MSLLLESIKISRQQAQLIDFHNERLNASRQALFGCTDVLDILDFLPTQKDFLDMDTIYKCRVLYRQSIEKIEFHPYSIQPIKSLKMVVANDIEYTHKSLDRTALQALFAQRGDCDDILIIKNNFVTDTSYGTPIFWDGQTWYCSDRPLLAGTRRAYYLSVGALQERAIRVDDLERYSHFKVINAMRGIDEIAKVSTEFIG